MGNIARISVVTAGACGLLLFAGGTSFAKSYDARQATSFGSSSRSDDWLGARGFGLGPAFSCSSWAERCINGSVRSGNVFGSENSFLSGNMSNSGSPDNINGNVNTHNTFKAGSNDNNVQRILK
jgi:hypothetical protein